MRITALSISDLRIIRRLDIEPGQGLNFIVGGNGAGKTSVLEAIYVAGRGHTFRHVSAGPMIRHGCDASTVLVRLRDEGSDVEHQLGIRREKSAFTCRLDGADVRKRSALAETLPVQWLASQPQLFLERGPEWRRRFFDMGLFHVEHDYLADYAEFARVLKQRNAALKIGDPAAVGAWDEPFVRAAGRLGGRRAAFVERLLQRTADVLADWQPGFAVAGRYRRGWREGSGLDQELARKLELDLRSGFTSVGPHRAEVELLNDGGALAEKTLSRGQQKMLVIALNLALADQMIAERQRRPVLLIDDLAAELDRDNQHKVVAALEDRDVQAFVASIADPGSLRPAAAAVFHVEHGEIA